MSKGCDVICVNLVDRTEPTTITDMAEKNDVPIIFFNRELVAEDLERWEKLYYVGADAFGSGIIEGELAAETFQSDPKYDKNGDDICQYVVLEGEAGHQDAIVRTEYSVNTLVEKGVKAEKLGYAIANWKRAQAQTKMTTLLEQYGERIELILANNDDMALGAIDALKASELPKDEWPIIVGSTEPTWASEPSKTARWQERPITTRRGRQEAMLKLAFVLSEKDPDSGLTLENIPIQDEKYVRMPYYRVTLDNVEEYVEWSKKKPDGVATTENTEITE